MANNHNNHIAVTIKTNLDKQKVKKDGMYPICSAIYHQGKSTTRSNKIYIAEVHWDDKRKLIRTQHPNASTLNRLLTKQLAYLQSELLLADDENANEFFKPTLAQKIEEKTKQSVFSFVSDLIG